MTDKEYRIDEYGDSFWLEYGTGGVLVPGERINDPTLTVGFVSNGQLLSSKLELRNRDYNPIVIGGVMGKFLYQIIYPGK